MIKIGILITDFESLKNWELRAIKTIIDDSELELSLLIKDGRTNKNKESFLPYAKSKSRKSLLYYQTKLEKKKFSNSSYSHRNKIIEQLYNIPTISLSPIKKDKLDIFTLHDAQSVKDYNLDVLLQYEFDIIRGPILQSSKYGIWSFHYGDISSNYGEPNSVLIDLLKKPCIEVTLQQLTPKNENNLIIDKAYFNKTRSLITTYDLIGEASVPLLFKNIQKLKKGKYSPTKSLVDYNPVKRFPSLNNSVKYIGKFYFHLVKRLIQSVNRKYFNSRYDCWTLFIGEGHFMDAYPSLKKLKPIKLPENEFWADPFFLGHNNEHYVFFENFPYEKALGKISCGRLENNKIVDVCDVLDLDYHLSYPFVFKEDGEIFLMPETNENKRLEIYKCVEFPKKWELYSTAFEGEMVFDATFYDDNKNQKWLFINKMTESTPYDSELYIYKVDSLKMNKLEPHHENPVIINSKIARNGGALFEYNNELYRPSQYNADGIYGRGLNINKIKELTIENYIEEHIVTIMPDFHKGINATHHLHQMDNHFIIDAAYKKK